jgi:hypothetical protein
MVSWPNVSAPNITEPGAIWANSRYFRQNSSLGIFLFEPIEGSSEKVNKVIILKKGIRVNQQPVSAARLRHGSQICFATFILQNITKLLITQQTLNLKKRISSDLECL